ncbi:MAG TPA: ATP-binding protein [Actinomycetota bacterium]|nr:ATP-binding protein [Actinomycetota bacterium]
MTGVDIAIPPRSVYVGVVRLAVAALARQAGLDEDEVDNLRIAVSEACTTVVLAQEGDGNDDPVTVRWDDTEDEVSVEIEGASPPAVAPADVDDSQGFSSRDVLSQALLESLVDESSFDDRDGGRVTRLVIRRH